MSNIYDIAKIAGVSIATVSKVINDKPDVSDKTKKKIRKIMLENNYIPNSVARSLTTNKSNSIGIIFNYEHEEGLHNMFFQEIVFGMERTLGKAGYDYVYFSDQKWHDSYDYDYLGKCKNRLVDGAILLGIYYDDNLTRLLESDIPVVLIDLEFNNESSTYVMCNHEEGAVQAVNYLADLGHRKIATLGPYNIGPSVKRTAGYKKVLQTRDLPQHDYWIVETLFEEKSGYQSMQKVLALKNRPTAVFCQSDVIAVGAMRAIKDAGLNIPDDFSIIGYDNIEICKYLTPSLTTIAQNTYQLGENAVAQLLKMFTNPSEKIPPVIMPTELIERASCRSI